MYSKKLAALVAASMVVATTPALAAPAAQKLSPIASVDGVRAAASVQDENALGGGGFWAAILGVALLAAFVLVVVEDDEVDLPESP